jgi:hypothetical protein
MAWSWSHTGEAYAAVQKQIEEKDREWLEVVWSEWISATPHPRFGISFSAELDERRYAKALIRAKAKSTEYLAEFIWEKTEAYATCSNGGWEAYCCPFDCMCHQVPFTPDEEQDLDDGVYKTVEEAF